jgi:toxin-antitoxin system PIN domain toxin
MKNKGGYLLDVNALIALADPDHKDHDAIDGWWPNPNVWAICPFTEAGFVRVTTNSSYDHPFTVDRARDFLTELATRRGYRYWAVSDPWLKLAAPFADRLFGPKQITDSYLLGLSVKNNAVLVTFDKAIGYLAGSEYGDNLLVLSVRPS